MAETNNNQSLLGTLAGGIPVIGNLAQGMINYFTQARNTEKTNKANREMAEYQYSKDVEMWNRANEYNSPQAQMQRLKEAGLNPHMVYGGGSATTQAATLPKYQAPSMNYRYDPPVDLPSTIQQFQDIQIKNAQIDNLKAQHDAITKSNFLKDIQGEIAEKTKGNKIQIAAYDEKYKNYWSAYMHNKNDIIADTLGYQIDTIKQKNRQEELKIDALVANTAKMRAGTDYTRLMTDWYSGKAIVGMLGQMGGLYKGIFGTQKTTMIPQLNQKTKYNSPTWWKGYKKP